MKEWTCIKVAHHKNIAKAIEEYQKEGWRLHTYTAAQAGMGEMINHYLLFQKGE